MTEAELLSQWPNMTPEQRNALVAELVMGWGRWEWCAQGHSMYRGPGWNWTIACESAPHHSEWLPSQSVRSAWSVVEEMIRRVWRLELFSPQEEFSDQWRCVFYSMAQDAVHADALSAPECICLAALLALMESP